MLTLTQGIKRGTRGMMGREMQLRVSVGGSWADWTARCAVLLYARTKCSDSVTVYYPQRKYWFRPFDVRSWGGLR